jgi:glutathione synthase/RimK-type ligase-like ATP-grasp enzyme
LTDCNKNIVIFTQMADIHACSVDYVLRSMGYNSILVLTPKIPCGETISVNFSGSKVAIRLGHFEGHVDDIQSSWNRRVSKLLLTPDFIHPADMTHIRENTHSTLLGIMRLLDCRFPVNPSAAFRVHANKLYQLQVASQCGFRVPKTLVSNNYADIQNFLQSTKQACVKPYYPQSWLTDSGARMTVTTKIGKDSDLPRESFEVMPQIYQEFIPKESEYRLTIFGKYEVASKIETKLLGEKGVVDWRIDPSHTRNLSVCELPRSVIEAARNLMSVLGLRFGTFDLAKTDDGDFYFFEVNEAGQWLWQELYCGDCDLLQPFCEYLISSDDNYFWDARRKITEFNAEFVLKAVEKDEYYGNCLTDEDPDKNNYIMDERQLTLS